MVNEKSEINFEDLQERRRQRRFYAVIFWISLGIYVVTLGAALIVFRSPLFRIRSISVTGNAVISEDVVLDVVRSVAFEGKLRPLKAMFGFRNMLAWPDGNISDPVLLPGARDITVEKNYGAHSIVIRVEERAPYGIWCLEPRIAAGGDRIGTDVTECWWFDGGGVIFKRAVDASGGLITVVHDYSQNKLGSRSKVLPEEFIGNTFSIFRVLRSSGLSVSEIALRDISLQELVVSTRNGPVLYFSLRFPAVNSLAAIKDLSGKPGFDKLQYLDFRAENRVYYK